MLLGLGIGGMGFVFGYLLAYSVKHTKEFNIDMLSAAIGAVGGGTVIELFSGTRDWLGPYGVGLFAGFVIYMALSVFFSHFHTKDWAKRMTHVLLGKPKVEP